MGLTPAYSATIPSVNMTQRLAEFVAGTPSRAIGTAAREQANRAVLDTLGVMLAGCREPAPKLVAEYAREQGGREEATVFGSGFQATAEQAALVNGTAAHGLDYDDVTLNMRGHPSAPLLPALLALGEKLGAGGRDVLDAYVLGFEVECKLGRAIGEPHYSLGWHATSTLGTIGAAAACARLLRLDAERARNALGIASSLASGLQQNFGTMTKPLHAGWAAHNGALAAGLASRAFEADAAVLEGPSGFLRAMSGGAEIDAEAAVRGLGDPWEIVEPGIGVKLYPCCYAIARSIDAALEVRSAGFCAEDITAVEVAVSPGTLIPLNRETPEDGLEAKFSLEYCVATALIDGRVGMEAFRDETVAMREDVRALAAKIAVREKGEQLNFPIEGRAEVGVTAKGASHSAEVVVPRGDPKNPLTWVELSGKFRDCAGTVLVADRVDAVIRLCRQTEGLSDIRELIAAIGYQAS